MGVSLTSGWLAWLLVLLGLAGAVLLLARRERWWWLFVVPLVVMVSAVAAWVIGEPVATNLFAEPLPPVIMCWIGVGIAGISLAVGSLFRNRLGSQRGCRHSRNCRRDTRRQPDQYVLRAVPHTG